MKIRVTSRLTMAIAVAATLALAPAAAAQTPIPPGNSAVNQYTESYPSAGGDRRAGDGDGRTPAQTLGRRKARRLEAQGAAGEATAALVAATAPASIDAGATRGASGGPAESGDGSGSGATSDRAGGPPLPAGSSGPSEVFGQATGLSTGALLTLAILLTALWALAYLWRRRRSDYGAGA